jgi:hypothetical protein
MALLLFVKSLPPEPYALLEISFTIIIVFLNFPCIMD